ncbi:hypothetical protein WJX79_010598 [Trebouxia sp. C0005]|nr:MAG: S-adenosyl-L-methionine-dependent methyltransferase [Trebouxia sp. A1-2]
MGIPTIPTRYLLGGAGLYAGVATAVYIRVKSNQCPEVCEHASAPDGQAFNALADTYDQQIGWDEKLMGITLLRWMLLRQAKGHVLEVSAGTGRNLLYYNNQQVHSVTMTDTSKNMLWHARQKHDRRSSTLPVKFCLADAQRMVSDPSASQANRKHDDASTSEQSQHASRLQDKLETFSPAQFDTVIDTFGLCSHQDPKAALQQMAAVCKPGGQLILLQHGKASWGWLNHRLDDEAQAHFAKWGCWWNRDILQLVHEARLIVESCSRWHFGTTYVIKARPPPQDT